jgi:eukaryotic-like serine/threonine-protein kinase
MTRASALDAAARSDTAVGASDSGRAVSEDRRLTDSNQAWLGKVVDGRYRVLEVIGRGGMGVVYRVEHLRMGKIAAMKVLHRDLASDPDVIGRFEREAAAISKLHHPHTVQVFDFGTAGEALYLIMEYVRGVDLAQLIQRDGPMSWSRAAPILAQVCSALQEAHELGIVHRDLKPENVLITRTAGGRDYAKVLDFGLAKLEQRAPSTMTDRQQIVGTPYFMSPEQIRGDDVDARSDIYSFGALMFELLTSQHLFQASTAVGVLTKHLTAEPDAPSMRAPRAGLDPQVDYLCRKALAKDPTVRWQSAAELATAIEDVFSETVGYGTGPGQRSKPIRRPLVADEDLESDLRLRRSDIDAFERGLRRQKYFTLLMLLVIVLAGAAAVAWIVLRTPPPLREEREPNNDANHANVIAAGTEVTGYVGKRMSMQDGDRDTFIVKWPGGSRRVVSVKVTGLPNLDVNLAVVDGDGMHGAQSDDSGVGEGEVLHRRAIDGPLVITVGETVKQGQLPIENVSDPYKLTVIEEKLAGETEPNASDVDANPLELTQEVRGYLDARNDVDQLRWTGADGDYNVVVRAEGLPLTWRLADGMLRTPGSARVTLKRGDLIKLERSDRVGSGTLSSRDVMWSIVVMPGQ